VSSLTCHDRGADDCVICAKHRGEGPLEGELVGQTPWLWVWHAPAEADGRTRLGHLIVESDQHAPHLADLTEDEATELGRLRTRLASSLREATGADFVLAAVIGLGIAHFHEHIYARPTREPNDVAWHDSDQLLPLVDDEAVRGLAERLRGALQGIA